jgi:hypothetical protein
MKIKEKSELGRRKGNHNKNELEQLNKLIDHSCLKTCAV